MTDPVYQRLLFATLVATVVTQAVFAAFPGIDLAVSGFFADGRAGFGWTTGWILVLNTSLKRLGESLAVGLALWAVFGGISRRLTGDALRAWVFAGLNAALASGVIVNLILKAHVGRARPADTLAFGGSGQFTPAWQVTDQCAGNCSFTSGEVSLAASLSFVALVLVWPRLQTASARILAIATAAVYIGVVALLRIGLGRHFLSDAIFSLLISAFVALALYPLLRMSRARHAFDPRLPLRYGADILAAGQNRARALLKRGG